MQILVRAWQARERWRRRRTLVAFRRIGSGKYDGLPCLWAPCEGGPRKCGITGTFPLAGLVVLHETVIMLRKVRQKLSLASYPGKS